MHAFADSRGSSKLDEQCPFRTSQIVPIGVKVTYSVT